jgi:rhamnose utilization protein RhaD (predicted bifunctional aldolase and dehydrogenase)
MKSAWVQSDAQALVSEYEAHGIAADFALRVYTTRLLGGDPALVLHGGGNTSVKLRMTDLVGEAADVLCVKGSGWDMGTIEPAGLPAVRLGALLKLRARKAMPDDEMVRVQRANLIDPSAPNPSVETLLHAFIPHKFVDHTHASAVLSLIDQPDGEARARGLRREHGLCALRAARLRPRQALHRRVRQGHARRRADPRQARHLHLRH